MRTRWANALQKYDEERPKIQQEMQSSSNGNGSSAPRRPVRAAR